MRLPASLPVLLGAVVLALGSCAHADSSGLEQGPMDGPAKVITAWVEAYDGQQCDAFAATILPAPGKTAADYVAICQGQTLGDYSPKGLIIGADRTKVTPPAEGATAEVRVTVRFRSDGASMDGDFFVAQVGDRWLVEDRPSDDSG